MKPDAADNSEFMPEETLGKAVKVITDEVVDGEYGLVINGHSLVRHNEHRHLPSLLVPTFTDCKLKRRKLYNTENCKTDFRE